MSKGLSETDRKHKHAHFLNISPLKKYRTGKPMKNINDSAMNKKAQHMIEEYKKRREENFVLDGVHEHVHKSNVVSSYNAINDPHAQSYFRQPAVQDVMKRAAARDGNLIPPAVPTYKLSIRRRVPSTPGQEEIAQREHKFIMDSIRTDSLKNRRNPVIPSYNALDDFHAHNYFKKKSVRMLLQRTCNIKI